MAEFGIVLEPPPSEAVVALTGASTQLHVQPAATQFKFVETNHLFEQHPVFLQYLNMGKSLFVWAGTIPPTMSTIQLTLLAKQVRTSMAIPAKESMAI